MMMAEAPTDHGAALEAVHLLRSTTAVRDRAQQLLARARAGASACFEVVDAQLAVAAAEVAQQTRQRYPDGRIPYHSRWRHFEAGGVDRLALLDARLGTVDAATRARALIDLVVVSVLLDAGAGPVWRYREVSGQTFTRSEGLGVASFHAFLDGAFSSDPARPLQANAAGLMAISAQDLGRAFQVHEANPLVGLESRAALLRRLGEVLAASPTRWGTAGRPGGMFDVLRGPEVAAHNILVQLLNGLSDIWPARHSLGGQALGDCWPHAAMQGEGLSAGWVPFHKLSQWLTYSLLEPFEWAGVTVTGLDALTGLPEYRNGGLLLDTGVLRPRVPDWQRRRWQAGDDFIVEWRALTVALLDELAPLVRAELGLSAAQLPLACVLEGGTWAAGRAVALRQRPGGLPPLNIESDGTVF
jgi:hypothetical protein